MCIASAWATTYGFTRYTGFVPILDAAALPFAGLTAPQGAMDEDQTACKPGSVSGRTGRTTTIHLGRPLPDASRDQPGRRGRTCALARPKPRRAAPTRSCSRRGLPCRRRRRRRGALLPHPFTLACRAGAGRAVCFLWHFPWGHPRRALPGALHPWSPDFPPAGARAPTGGRPAV